MHSQVLSFRAGHALIVDTQIAAALAGQKLSEYIRTAVQEKNDRLLVERIACLSDQLAAAHRDEHRVYDGAVGDGLA